MRSRAAAQTLGDAGFSDVHSLEGGMKAWDGLVAEGIPEAGMAYFSGAERPEELIGLSWLLEDGSGIFYSELAKVFPEVERQVFEMLEQAEGRHKDSLFGLYRDIFGKVPDEHFPGSVLRDMPRERVMEGGMSVAEALQWTRDKDFSDVLELCLSLETNSYDLYIKMRRVVDDERAIRVFSSLAEEEKQHLKRLTAILDERLSV